MLPHPPAHSLLGDVARAIVKIEKHPFPGHLTPPAREMLDTLGRYSGFWHAVDFGEFVVFFTAD